MSVEWYTPAYIVEAARRTMGGIDLDPASCEEANRTVKAEGFYTIAQDGLLLPWAGRVWLNPPFGDQDCRAFGGKLVDSFDRGLVDEACFLMVLTPDCRLQVRLLSRFASCFPMQKVMFARPGSTSAAIQFPIFVSYLGPNIEQFADCFSSIGACCRPIRPYTPQPTLL